MKKIILPIILGLLVVGAFWLGVKWESEEAKTKMGTPEIPMGATEEKDTTLLPYTIENLSRTKVTPGKVVIEGVTAAEDDYLSAIFSFNTNDDKKMTGLMNVPRGEEATMAAGTVLMLRGYVAPSNYVSGTGTKNAGIYFAKNGFVTLAPDFLGYGDSEAAPEDSWLGRFEKPLQVKKLLVDMQNNNFECAATNLKEIEKKNEKKRTAEETAFLDWCDNLNLAVKPDELFMWAHSNGGQIALTTLEINEQMIPTTLWAPVSVGFPYSVLFFTDEYEDEGKGMRAYIASLEKNYDVFDFSHTKHLDKLPQGQQFLWHHGTADDAALIAWSDEMMNKLEIENEEREQEAQIITTYYRYEGTDHNLRPMWDTVIARDVEFFKSFLTKNE